MESRQLFRSSSVLIALAAAPLVSRAQSLHLAPAAGTPGSSIAIEISLKSPKGQEPSTLQWQITIPLEKVGPLQETSTGPAAQAAGKSVICSIKSTTTEAYTTVCMLAGGQQSIRNGTIAVFHLTLPPTAAPGSFQIRLDEGLAVDKDLKRKAIEPSETTVTVRKK
jgi:hypothetical protein